MSKDKLELIDGFFNKGWACDLDEVYSAVIDTINDLQKKAEQGEHYKHLYSEVKKQKDDVVEYINGAIENDDIEELKEGRHLLLWNEDLDKLLRMLGEIDE